MDTRTQLYWDAVGTPEPNCIGMLWGHQNPTGLGCSGETRTQLYWDAVGTPEPNEDHNFTETVTTKKTFRMTGINFFQICNSRKESQTVSHASSFTTNYLKTIVSYPNYSFHYTISNWIHCFNHRHNIYFTIISSKFNGL